MNITQGTLTVLSAVKSDSDSYICEASNQLGSSRAGVQLVVVSIPKFTQKPEEAVSKKLHEEVTLLCRADGSPPPVISWRKDSGQLPTGRTRIQGGSLTINGLSTSDAGTYTCVATSAGVFHSEASVRLQVVLGMYSRH